VRDGAVVPLELTTQLPLGLATTPYRADTVRLEPGDRFVMVTDGYLEHLSGRLDVEDVLRGSLDRHPRQIVQELGRAVREITGGDPRDDATVLCLDWYGPAGRRQATGGASRARATRDP
jgi:serine phosphatase RsbU (regulator of sigma subunit)